MGSSASPLRILFVENEPLIVEILVDIAEDAGWQLVGSATTLDDAAELATAADCNFAVLDIHLDDGITSLPIASILRERNVPFLFASGLAFAGCVPGFEGVPVLLKPFRHATLVEAVTRISRV